MAAGHLVHLFCLALLDASLKGAALVTVAAAAAWLLRRHSAAARHTVWALALCGVLLLPVLARVVPTFSIHAPAVARHQPNALPAAASLTHIQDLPLRYPHAPEAAAPEPVTPLAAPVPARPAARPLPDLWELALAIWIFGVVISLFRLGRSLRWVRRLVAGCRPAGGALARLATELQGDGARQPGVRMLIGEREGLSFPPLTCGMLHPAVLLPAEAEAWSPDCARAVLLHELAHVRRGDWLKQLLARCVCAVYWFHPAVWWAESRLRLEAERACDEQVLRTGVRPSEYAAILLEVTRMLRAKTEAPLCVAMTPTGRRQEGRLAQRLQAVLSPAHPRRSRVLAGLACLLVAGGAAFLGALQVSAAERRSTTPVAVTISSAGHGRSASHRRTWHSRTPVAKRATAGGAAREVEQARAALKQAQIEVQHARAEAARARDEALKARAEAQAARAALAESVDKNLAARVAEQLRNEERAKQLEERQQALQEEAELLKHDLEASRTAAQAAQRRYEVGQITADEVAQAKLQAERAEIGLKAAMARLQQLRSPRSQDTLLRTTEDDLLRLQAEADKHRAELETLDAQLAITRARYDAGIETKVELDKILASRESAAISLKQAQVRLQQLQARLEEARRSRRK